MGKNWAAYTLENRDQAAKEMGVVRRKRADAGGGFDLADYLKTQQVVDEVFWGGDVQKACGFVAKLSQDNLDHLRTSLEAWQRLVDSAGSAETARNVLETMRQNGTVS